MIKRIGQALGLSDSPAGAVARAAFAREYPSVACDDTQIRATEPARFIVAVFYHTERPILPPPYKLYSVTRDLSTVEELRCDPSSPYWIRGRK